MWRKITSVIIAGLTLTGMMGCADNKPLTSHMKDSNNKIIPGLIDPNTTKDAILPSMLSNKTLWATNEALITSTNNIIITENEEEQVYYGRDVKNGTVKWHKSITELNDGLDYTNTVTPKVIGKDRNTLFLAFEGLAKDPKIPDGEIMQRFVMELNIDNGTVIKTIILNNDEMFNQNAPFIKNAVTIAKIDGRDITYTNLFANGAADDGFKNVEDLVDKKYNSIDTNITALSPNNYVVSTTVDGKPKLYFIDNNGKEVAPAVVCDKRDAAIGGVSYKGDKFIVKSPNGNWVGLNSAIVNSRKIGQTDCLNGVADKGINISAIDDNGNVWGANKDKQYYIKKDSNKAIDDGSGDVNNITAQQRNVTLMLKNEIVQYGGSEIEDRNIVVFERKNVQ